MNIEFKPVNVEAIKEITPFFGLRPNKTCDSVFLDHYLWKDYYQVKYAVWEGKAVLWLMEHDGGTGSAMPACGEEELADAFAALLRYFNQELGRPLRIHLADEEAVKSLHLREMTERFRVTEQDDWKDYLYDGESLRTLPGKKYHKKKNHLNHFVKAYEGRYEYCSLDCSARDEIWDFLVRWREGKGEETEEHLDYEVQGIRDILENCRSFHVHMGGVRVDKRLEAFSLGSYNPFENMAVIHIEKANPDIRGLYPFINQQFLLHEFPEAALVNREDDLGIEGLRKAKLSYYPVGFAGKYEIVQIDFQG